RQQRHLEDLQPSDAVTERRKIALDCGRYLATSYHTHLCTPLLVRSSMIRSCRPAFGRPRKDPSERPPTRPNRGCSTTAGGALREAALAARGYVSGLQGRKPR